MLNQTKTTDKIDSWIKKEIGSIQYSKLKQDASLRCFYRLQTDPTTILMDSSQEEKLLQFINSARTLQNHQLKVPTILKSDLQHNFLQMEDFGNQHLCEQLTHPQLEIILDNVLHLLLQLQTIPANKLSLPIDFVDKIAYQELELFQTFFVEKHLDHKLSLTQKAQLEKSFLTLIEQLNQQPQVVMHRDFHGKNLMLLPNLEIGLLDFQDLMLGPYSYDLISLLEDIYIEWPTTIKQNLKRKYHECCGYEISFDEFSQHYDSTALQRYLKILGGFSKIYYERGLQQYLKFFPKILQSIQTLLKSNDEFSELTFVFRGLQCMP